MTAFAGEYIATIDDKRRIVLPSAFKKAMGELASESLIIEKNHLNMSLDIHPEKSWKDRVIEFKSTLDPFDPDDDALLQFFFQNFVTVGMAANGRINIPNEYLEFANLKKSVKFIGMDNSIRLVVAGKLEKPKMSSQEYLKKLQDKRKRRQLDK